MRIVAALLVLFAVPVQAAELTGIVSHVRDGDTIEVENIPIRLNGVSAPERNEPLHTEGKVFMRGLVEGKPVKCFLNGERTHDRLVGICALLDGREIGQVIISEGLARDCPRYSGGRYARFETDEARQRIKLPPYCK